MRYYGYLLLVLVSLMASVFVQGENLFASDFFTVSYVAMALVLVVGSKNQESFVVDVVLGTLLIFAVGFMSTETLIEIVTNKQSGNVFFKLAILVGLDYAAIGFLRAGMGRRKFEALRRDDRYGIYGQ